MALPSVPPGYGSREALRIGGGYNSPATGASPAGGLDIDPAGNLATNGDITLDGTLDAAQVANLHFTGTLKPEPGGCDKTWSHYVPATHMLTTAGASAGMTYFNSSNVYLPQHSFPDGQTSYVGCSLGIPADYDGSNLRISLLWSSLGGTAGNVLWNVRPNLIADSETLDVGSGSGYQLILDVFQGPKLLHIASNLDEAGGADPGDPLLSLLIGRRGLDASDTFDGTALLLGVQISY